MLDALSAEADPVLRHGGFFEASMRRMFVRTDRHYLDVAAAVVHETEHGRQPNRRTQVRAVVENAASASAEEVGLARLRLDRELPAYRRQREFVIGMLRRAAGRGPAASPGELAELARRVSPGNAWLLVLEGDFEVKVGTRLLMRSSTGRDLAGALYGSGEGVDGMLDGAEPADGAEGAPESFATFWRELAPRKRHLGVR